MKAEPCEHLEIKSIIIIVKKKISGWVKQNNGYSRRKLCPEERYVQLIRYEFREINSGKNKLQFKTYEEQSTKV